MPRVVVRRWSTALAVGAAMTLGYSAVASAAVAPVRTIGIDKNGARTPYFFVQAASPDGSKVFGFDESPPNYDGGSVIRDVVAGTTTKVLDSFEFWTGISDDLTWVTFVTNASHLPQDTNGSEDTYLLNTKTGEYRLMGRDQNGNAPTDGELQNAYVTPDGKTVVEQLRRNNGTAGSPSYAYASYRYDIATGAISHNATTGKPLPMAEHDDAGRVQVTTDGIFTPTKRFDLPSGVGGSSYVSPDGGTIVAHTYDFTGLVFFNTRTGAVRSAQVPSWLGNTWDIQNASNDGSATIGETFGADHDTRVFRVGRLTPDGNLSQIGGDVPVGAVEGQHVSVTRNSQFAYSGLVLAQLGNLPLPGTEPTAPLTTQVGDYLDVIDSYCTTNTLQRYARPTLTLGVGPRAADFRTAKSATVTVTKTSTGVVTGSYTLAPGKGVQLYTGYTGNFTITGTVNFWDGTKITGKTVVPAHAAPSCSFF